MIPVLCEEGSAWTHPPLHSLPPGSPQPSKSFLPLLSLQLLPHRENTTKTHCTANFCSKDAEQSEEQLTHGDLSGSFRISLRLLRAMTVMYIWIINALNRSVTHLIRCLAHDKLLRNFIYRGQNNIIIQVKVALPYTAVILSLSRP